MSRQPPITPSHPGDEILAGFVDDSLEPGEWAEVRRHLAACEPCRDEVGLAERAREALRSTPEATVPVGAADAVMGEVRREAARVAEEGARNRAADRWRRVATVAAAAAIVGLGAFVIVPQLGTTSPGDAGAGGAGGTRATMSAAPEAAAESGPAEATPAPGASDGAGEPELPPVERRDVDFGPDSLGDLAALDGPEDRTAAVSAEFEAVKDSGVRQCLSSLRPEGEPVRLVRLILATYRSSPAYIGVTRGGGEVVVRAVARPGCEPLATARAPA